MRILTILFLMATAHGSPTKEDPGTVQENLKKLGKSISREVESLSKKAHLAANELGEGFNRAWARLKGETPEDKK